MVSLRITGGSLRGRTLRGTARRDIRSTSARVRGALFNVVGDVTGLNVADLYCGTGILGIEALSRGAAYVEAVDRSPLARSITRANVAQIDLELRSQHKFVRLAVEDWVGGEGEFDLILADPPYADHGLLADVLDQLSATGRLRSGGLVVIEHDARRGPIPDAPALEPLRTYRYGDSALTVLRAAAPLT